MKITEANMIGARFVRLTVLSFVDRDYRHSYWRCVCDCGVETTVSANKLRKNHTRSCGCLKREMASRRFQQLHEAWGGAPPDGPLTQDRLRQLFDFDAERGGFVRKVTRGAERAGNVAGVVNDGYLVVSIDRRKYLVHRLIWFWHKGEWPKEEIDHADLVRGRNDLENIREASRTQNNGNHPVRKDNTIGIKGVFRNKDSKKYFARITYNRTRYSLGGYNSPEEASAAYLKKAKELFGEFARAA